MSQLNGEHRPPVLRVVSGAQLSLGRMLMPMPTSLDFLMSHASNNLNDNKECLPEDKWARDGRGPHADYGARGLGINLASSKGVFKPAASLGIHPSLSDYSFGTLVQHTHTHTRGHKSGIGVDFASADDRIKHGLLHGLCRGREWG